MFILLPTATPPARRAVNRGLKSTAPLHLGVNDSDEAAKGVTFDDAALLAGLETFGGDAEARRVVARHARDLADSGRYETDADVELSPEHVVVQLADAPRGGPVERWNWWIGSLDLAFGGYAEFRVRQLE